MTDEDKYEYWLDIAQYDLKTAESMYKDERWLYVIFMCEQAIEKLVKGLFTLYQKTTPPPKHDINALFVQFEGKLNSKTPGDYKVLFAELNTHYLNSRYPDFKQKLSASVDKPKAKRVLEKSKEVFAWLETLKP